MAQLGIGEVKELIVHHSASPLSTRFRDIVAWHTKPKPQGRGWPMVGYHRIILADGSIREGRPLNVRGAHAPPNKGRIGICLVGDNTKAGQKWTRQQKATLRRFCQAARVLYPQLRIVGHRDVMRPGYTECPGLSVADLLGE